jgi:hypothetical protein
MISREQFAAEGVIVIDVPPGPVCERMPRYMAGLMPKRFDAQELETHQDALLERTGRELLADGVVHASLHIFCEHMGLPSQVVFPANGFMVDDESKNLLVRLVRQQVPLWKIYATLLVSESWIAEAEVAEELMRRRAAGERLYPADIAGRYEGLIVALDTRTHNRLCTTRIVRDDAGKVVQFEPRPTTTTAEGRLFSFFPSEASKDEHL